jgi:hypothetical protein
VYEVRLTIVTMTLDILTPKAIPYIPFHKQPMYEVCVV